MVYQGEYSSEWQPDPRLHHADHPADHRPVPAGAEAHRRGPHGGRGQGMQLHGPHRYERRLLMRKVGIRHHRLRRDQHRLPQGGAALPASRDSRPWPTCAATRPRSAAREFGVPALRVDQLLKRDDIEIVINLTVPLAHTDVSLAVLRRRQARPFREAARRERRRGAQGDGPRRRRRAARRLRARHVPRRRPPDRAQADRRRRDRHAGRRQRLLHVSRATSAGIPRPASTTCAAAGRCSTWGRTTSPISCSCSARSRASWARPRAPQASALITSEPHERAR